MKNIIKYPVTILFVIFIMTFSVIDLFTPDTEYSELENVYFSKSPKFTVSAILDSSDKGFALRYEKYINEQFPLRNSWITLKSLCESALMKVENNNIVYGDDGYLFTKYQTEDNERKERNISLLEEFATLYPELRKTLLIAPSAYAVMPDRLPTGLGNIDQISSIDALEERLADSGWGSVDIVSTLVEADPYSNEIFYRTDHHWTTEGAYNAYVEYAQERGLAVASFDPILATEDFYGTHFSKAKKFNIDSDQIHYADYPLTSFTIDDIAKESMYDKEKLDTRDKYAMFLYGNNGVTIIENEDAEEGTVMVIKDSFANCFTPFLTQSYSRVIVIDLRSLREDLSEVIKREQPQELLMLYNYKNIVADSDLPRLNY